MLLALFLSPHLLTPMLPDTFFFSPFARHLALLHAIRQPVFSFPLTFTLHLHATQVLSREIELLRSTRIVLGPY
jgi:hypothetical protein